MKIKSQIIKIFFFTTAFFFVGCETVDLNQTDNPSGVDSSMSDPVYAFNYVQLQLADFVDSANSFTQRVTRQMAMTGGNTYDNSFEPASFNNNWNTGYRLMNAVNLMEDKSIENKQYYALGAAKVIKAYVMVTMVDMYGDIPYSQALKGAEFLNPKFDKGEDVYNAAFTVLDEAVELLQRANSVNPQDLYYSSQADWIRLANTLRLKMYITARQASSELGLTDAQLKQKVEDIINGANYIDETSEDFAFKYGTSRFTPNSRHPMYNDQYELGGGAYISNYFMWAMSTEKNIAMGPNGVVDSQTNLVDPRTNFYFYKQDENPGAADTFTLPGRSRPSHYDDAKYNSFYVETIRTPYSTSNWVGQTAITSNGFWGRDHGDNSGIPPDSENRTVGGLYPCGGAYGTAGSVQTGGDKGALGQGIMPILMSSYVHFLKAEAILTMGISGDAKSEMITAITQSIDRTIQPIGTYPVISSSLANTISIEKTNYLDFISDFYDGLSSTKKLEMVVKEYYLASWGNGIEPYNNYRRTGYPSNMQPTLEVSSGAYYYRALYSGESVNNNPNAPVNIRTTKVFWDKAGLDLQ